MAKLIKKTKEGIHVILTEQEYEFVQQMGTLGQMERKSNKLIAIDIMAAKYPVGICMQDLLPMMREAGAVFASRSPLKALGVMMNQYGETFVKTSGEQGLKSYWTIGKHLRKEGGEIELEHESEEDPLKLAIISAMQDGGVVMTVGEIAREIFTEDADIFGAQDMLPSEQVRELMMESNGKDFFKMKDNKVEKWRLSGLLRGGE